LPAGAASAALLFPVVVAEVNAEDDDAVIGDHGGPCVRAW
jgi:hypothetical protein